MLGVVVVALTAFLFFSGSSLSLPFNSDPHALLASDSLGIKTGPLPRTAMPIDSGGTKLGVRDTSAKKDTMTILSKSFDSHPQNISGSDSLGIRTRALPKIAALPDSTGIKLGVRDTSANRDSLIFFPNSLGFHFREMSGIESLVSKTVPMPKLGATDESSRRDSLLRLPKRTRDSLARADSIRRVPRDSTARIAQFLYHRTDSPIVSFFDERTYAMFGKSPSLIIRYC